MDIYLANGRKARLAGTRLRTVIEEGAAAPWHDSDLVFNPFASVAAYSPLYDPEGKQIIAARTVSDGQDTLELYTTEERVKELCGDDPKYLTPDGIEKLCWAPEKKEILDWLHGKNFGYLVEKWDEKERRFLVIDSLWGMTGVACVLDNIKSDSDHHKPDVICVDDDASSFFNITRG